MRIQTAEDYIQSLKKLNLTVYAGGKKLENPTESPLIRPHVNAAAMTYALANDPKFSDLMTATSHLTGKTINRFTHIHQSTDDLVRKVKMLRLIAQRTGTCFQRCVGLDAINALYTVTYEMDAACQTRYHEKFKQYLTSLQERNIMVAGAMTDPKGDRGLKPSQQPDPDMYVHIVSQNEEGIIIKGAKAHMTGIVNSHEMLIMPTTALDEEDKAYALSCAIPTDAPGIIHIFGKQTNEERKFGSIDQGNYQFGIVGGEALTVLDNVFVPWERVFMCGETQFSGLLVERFACYHRQNYGACKTGVSDIVIGASAAMAQYNGAQKASHIKDKIIEMVHLAETLYCGSIACSSEGAPTNSGAYFVDPLLANTVKQNITRYIYEIDRLAQDIAGGLIGTLPSEQDFFDPKIGPLVEKYFKGAEGYTTEDRIRMARLIENMTGGTALVESMHGAGSPQAQRVMIYRQANLEHKIKLAKALAGTSDSK
jgi:4-hydroxybutyryl-CoA dehydratase/vinylacetyl-CoA-Delta-isomerase